MPRSHYVFAAGCGLASKRRFFCESYYHYGDDNDKTLQQVLFLSNTMLVEHAFLHVSAYW